MMMLGAPRKKAPSAGVITQRRFRAGKSLLAAQRKIYKRSQTVPRPAAPVGAEAACPAWAEAATNHAPAAAARQIFTKAG
jgi:hypothetical protein